MSRYIATVTQIIVVTVDRKKFTNQFMKEFREQFYQFHTVEEHIEHLAQLHARGMADNTSFIEGYGQATDMGIHFKVRDQDVDAVKER